MTFYVPSFSIIRLGPFAAGTRQGAAGGERRLFQPCVPCIFAFLELLGERTVLRVNRAGRSDDSRIQLGHVAAAREYIGNLHPGLDSVKRHHLIGPASRVQRLVRGRPIGRVDRVGDHLGNLRGGNRCAFSHPCRNRRNLRARRRRDPRECSECEYR